MKEMQNGFNALEPLMTVKEVAKYLSAAEYTVRVWIRRGVSEAPVRPGFIRIPQSAVRNFIAQHLHKQKRAC